MNDNIKPESPFDPFSYPYNPDNDGTTNPNPLDEYGNPLINPQLYDPLALDLDGDEAISLINAKDGSVYFDHNGDGVKFRSS